jgi:hypothetical protein
MTTAQVVSVRHFGVAVCYDSRMKQFSVFPAKKRAESDLHVDRRDLLKYAGSAAGLGLLQGCATGNLIVPNYQRPFSTQPFARPIIRTEEVIRTRVGLRPYRATGFVVRSEKVGDTQVIHNYGHGGGGITMSWGSSTLAARELPDIADKRAVVLGCGVMGLTTARLLQQRGWQITILAKELPPYTTPTSPAASGHQPASRAPPWKPLRSVNSLTRHCAFHSRPLKNKLARFTVCRGKKIIS